MIRTQTDACDNRDSPKFVYVSLVAALAGEGANGRNVETDGSSTAGQAGDAGAVLTSFQNPLSLLL